MKNEIKLRNDMLPRIKTWPITTLQRHRYWHNQSLNDCDLDKEIGRHKHWWHSAYIRMISEVLSEKN